MPMSCEGKSAGDFGDILLFLSKKGIKKKKFLFSHTLPFC
jgi:hypothetical protein